MYHVMLLGLFNISLIKSAFWDTLRREWHYLYSTPVVFCTQDLVECKHYRNTWCVFPLDLEKWYYMNIFEYYTFSNKIWKKVSLWFVELECPSNHAPLCLLIDWAPWNDANSLTKVCSRWVGTFLIKYSSNFNNYAIKTYHSNAHPTIVITLFHM